MNRKILLGIMMIGLVAILVTPVLAEHWEPDWAKFVGGGVIDTIFDPTGEEIDESIRGHRCHISVSGAKRDDAWMGRVQWTDLDWEGGVLLVLFKVHDGQLLHDDEGSAHPEIFQLFGQAKVFVGGAYMGAYSAGVELADSAHGDPSKPDWIGLVIWQGEHGGDTIYWTGHPRIARGDIRTWWYPEYPG